MAEEFSLTEYFPVADVYVDRETRQRTTLDKDVQALAESIERTGLIHPITIYRDGKLVAGERRLEAHKRLKRELIRVQFRENLSPIEAYLIELRENIDRRALPWQDEVRAVLVYHNMRKQVVPEWTILGTANDIGMSKTQTQKYLTVALEVGDPEVGGCQTLEGAFNLIKGRAERARAAASNRGLEIAQIMPTISPATTKEERTAAVANLFKGGLDVSATSTARDDADFAAIKAGKLAEASLAEAARKEEQVAAAAAASPVVTADFIDWIETYEGPAFDVLHFDFPYGKDYKGSNTRRTGRAHIAPAYADSPDIMWALVEAFLANQDKIAYPVAHLIFWYDMDFHQPLIESITAAGWRLVQPHPLIWHKPYQGVAADPKRRPRHTYETALFFSRGDRKLVKLDQDVFVGRVDEKLHMNQKDQAMLRQFLGMVVDQHTAIFDPTCGSGSALAAAKQLGAQRILGLELDPSNAEVARFLLARDGVIVDAS